ncbi:RrF2 family transcriptional regulator [Litoreibacter janthinus]|uniref:Transcriptional regulator, BadM/Rrf2 family n=1 Tax=Litoreibacter janthinus TaxID=670154 RepID=A0A1I6HHJ1_9RHOB|nr:Rrf2 family transcriptional regulator [Litoreibacter janthinus]SFR53770.1 transcriptional regulator, BadM/Rrf2 family [Litoreibacter janthinus]
MRLTTRTNLATRILMACAVNDGLTVRTSEIAAKCNASVNHLLQVVNLLQGGGFVETLRGRSGGIRLTRAMDQISIGEVFRLFESGAPFAECFDAETNTCPLAATCRLRSFITRALEAFYHELDMVTLEDLVKGNCGLNKLLDMTPRIEDHDCLQPAKA